MSVHVGELTRQPYRPAVRKRNRAIDKVAHEMAADILGDPEFRDKMRRLLREAFARARQELGEA